MSIKEIKINLFCKTLEELMEDLSKLYPYDATLLMCLTMYKSFSSLYDKEEIVKQVTTIIKPYADKILQKEESFFLHEAHEDFKDDAFILNEINKIRKIWIDPSTSNETKECIWKYMISFVKIGKSLKLC